jgi:hypothetical protein
MADFCFPDRAIKAVLSLARFDRVLCGKRDVVWQKISACTFGSKVHLTLCDLDAQRKRNLIRSSEQ